VVGGRSAVDIAGIDSAFAVALHMHQPLIPASGPDLRTAAIISNLQWMLEHPDLGDNHNAPVFHRCYKRMGQLIPQLLTEGRQPRIMLEYSGPLLHGLRRAGLNDVFDALRPLTLGNRSNGSSEASVAVGASRFGVAAVQPQARGPDRALPGAELSGARIRRVAGTARPVRSSCADKVIPSASTEQAAWLTMPVHWWEMVWVGWVAAPRAHQCARCRRARAGCLVLTSGRVLAIGSTIVARSSRSRSPVIDPSSASAVTRAACAAMTWAATPGATVA
jgi:hypothetical protein